MLMFKRLRRFASATQIFISHFSSFHCALPLSRSRMPPKKAKAKAKGSVTNTRPEPKDAEDEDIPPLEEEEDDRLHPAVGLSSESSDSGPPAIPDGFNPFAKKEEHTQEQVEEEAPEHDEGSRKG